MSNQNDNTDFLKYAVKYLENRIAMLDSKCSILIAIEAGFFGLATLLLKPVLQDDFVKCRIVGYLILLLLLVFSAGTIYYLIKTIRPTKCFWDREPQLKHYLEDSKKLISFTKDFPGLEQTRNMQMRYIDRLNSLDIEGNYREAHFVALQLLQRKYHYYEDAILWMKAALVWAGFSLLATILLKFPTFDAGHYSIPYGNWLASSAIFALGVGVAASFVAVSWCAKYRGFKKRRKARKKPKND